MITAVIGIKSKAKDLFPAFGRLAEEYPDKTIGDFKICQFCRHTGFDVETQLYYVGGKGYVPGTYCMDRVACWTRWDNGHN